MSTIRVFLVDDHEVVRRGVADLLHSEGDIEVVGEAGTCAGALVRIPTQTVDVAVLDVQLPDGDGVNLCRDLRTSNPNLQVLMLTSFDDDEALISAILAGAQGFVLKQIRGNDLVAAVRTVAGGGSMLDPAATAKVMARIRSQSAPDTPDPLAALNEQERKILELIGEGMTNRQIGDQLFFAEKTVKNYVSSILAKLGLQRRTQAAVLVSRRRD